VKISGRSHALCLWDSVMDIAPALAGASAGVAEALAVQPFDMLKTRFQLHSGKNPSMFQAVRQVLAEGGILRLYRGLLPELAGNVPTRSAMYWSRDFAAGVLEKHATGGEKLAWSELLAGGFAGLPEGCITTPFQVVKVRMQNKGNNAQYRHSLDCFLQIIRLEGPMTLLTALPTTIARNSVWNGVYFSSMCQFQLWIGDPPGGRLGHQLVGLGTGFCAGVTATCANAPLDVAKSRIQGSPAGGDQRYRSTFQTLARIAREEGVKALYKGFVPKAWRMGTGGAVGIMTYEFAHSFLRA